MENPYASPAEESMPLDGPDADPIGQRVGQGVRFLNLFIDYIVTYILGFVGGIVVGVVLGPNTDEGTLFTAGMIVGMLTTLAYYILLEGATGRTIGKMVTGTVVVNEQGQRASMGQVVGRSFARFIPFEPFSFLGPNTRGWHDSLAKTYVVKAR